MVQKRNSISHEKISYQGIKRSLSEEKDGRQGYKHENDEGKIVVDDGLKFGKRHAEAIFYFFAVFICFLMRVNLSLTIVAMTDPKVNENKDIPTFNWTNRNIILSSFFWGYVVPQIAAGWLMTRYGPKWFLICTIGIGSVIGFLIPPLAVHIGSTAVIIARTLQGFCQGFMIPAVSVFMSRWVPLAERGRTGTFIFAAGSLGTVFGMMIAGSISASPYGWPMVFHFFSSLGIIWSVLYAICGCNLPSESKSITPEERDYIEKTSVVAKKKPLRTPWREMLTSAPYLALLYASICFILGFWMLLTQIPTYMNKIMLFDLKSNGLLSALPYILQWILSLVLSIISDHLTNKNILSITMARKLFTSVGMICPAVSLILLSFCGKEDTTLAILALVIGIGSNGASLCGTFLNSIDLSPNFAGVLQGVTNGFSNIFAIIAPLIVEIIVTDEQNPEHWRRVFYFASAVYISGAVIFGFLGSGEIQPWNDDKKDEDITEDA